MMFVVRNFFFFHISNAIVDRRTDDTFRAIEYMFHIDSSSTDIFCDDVHIFFNSYSISHLKNVYKSLRKIGWYVFLEHHISHTHLADDFNLKTVQHLYVAFSFSMEPDFSYFVSVILTIRSANWKIYEWRWTIEYIFIAFLMFAFPKYQILIHLLEDSCWKNH